MGLVEQNEKKPQENLKVLIADDDAPTRILLRAAISQWGYDTVEAKDGGEAWEIMQQTEAPRLLILDWLMPVIDGIALCERSKKELAYHPYIILLTQVTGTTNLIKGLEAGADEFLSKPFNMAELRSRLSIGARIVKYENRLAEQNKQLQVTIEQMQTSVTISLEILREIYAIFKTQDAFAENKTVEDHMQKIQSLHTNLEKIVEVIKKFQADTNIRS